MSKELLHHSLPGYAQQISTRESDLLNRLHKETEKLPGSKMLSST